MTKHARLGVNIDHIATLRQARGTLYPCPIQGALNAELAGADGITLHLREDRRHIQDEDVRILRPLLKTPMNLEMAATDEMLAIAERIKPSYVCLVPEKREELTTEGGLDVVNHFDNISRIIKQLKISGVHVSLFIDPCQYQINASLEAGAKLIELHTGTYADEKDLIRQKGHLETIESAAHFAHKKGLVVNAGHGLNEHNVLPIAAIPIIYELNIGHALIAKALVIGLTNAVAEMKSLIIRARAE
jgi:pyridoxine 5-phosphate synthase